MSAAPGPRVARWLRRTKLGRAALARTRTRRSVAVIRASGLFDESWYRSQLGPSEHVGDAITHFVTDGADRGLQPHPLFDPGYYRRHDRAARRSDADPFTHFLKGGCRRGLDPHPLFETAHLLTAAPEASRHRYGAFGWYLVDRERRRPSPSSMVPSERAPTPARFIELVQAALAEHAAVPDHTAIPRTYAAFDHDAAAAYVAHMASVVADSGAEPLVSVIVPTKDRAKLLPATLRSVLDQTYRHLEVIVVDDGSIDETAEVVAALDDPRIRYVRQENAGVAAARNHGLRLAAGELIAYLDSDNTWKPEFLTTMVGTLRSTGARAAYAASELRGDGRLEYRGRDFDRDVLLERNYIDCITLVHERSLTDEIGGFDEALRRVVDWDLLIRLSAVTDLAYAPFVATSYDLWDDGGERITRTESVGYRYEVRAKHLVAWEQAGTPVTGRTSVLLVVRSTDDDAAGRVRSLLDAHRAARDEVELVVVDNGTPRDEAWRLRLLARAESGVTLTRIADRVNVTTALNVAASLATGDVSLILDVSLDIDPDRLHLCVDDVRGGRATAVQPLYLNLDGSVASSGWLTTADGRPVGVGDGLAAQDRLVTVSRARDALDLYGFAVDTRRLREVGGFAPVYVQGFAELDLGRRLRENGGTCEVSVTTEAQLPAWPAIRRQLPAFEDAREFHRRGGTGTSGTFEALVEAAATVEVVGWRASPRFSYHGPNRWAATFVRRARGPRRWAIKVAAPDLPERHVWGDWHFALALRAALERAGEHAVVDLRRGWHRPTADIDEVDLVLRGTQRYDAPPGRRTLLWVISHPDHVLPDEVAAYDGVFVASEVYAEEAARRWGRDVEPLLQATDPARFRPDPDPALATPLLFVGNSRGVRRRIVADAVDAGLEPTIFGAGWEGLVPDHLIRGEHVPNEDLARYYSSAEVVLADHWDDMRERGFLANRLFDAVAAGASVVSDDVAGADELFAGRVRTYRDRADLPEVVAAAREARRRLGPVSLDGHTFDDRARRLIRWLDETEGA